MYKFVCVLLLIAMLTSCTYSVNVVHSQGTASDLVDENQAADPNIEPSLSLPAGVI